MQDTEFRSDVIKPIDCVKEAWEIIRSDYWLLFAISLVGALIGGVSLYILIGPMVCGIFYCYLQKIDGSKVNFDDLWKGFGWFLPGFIVMLVLVVPMLVVYGIIYAPLIAAAIMGQNLSQDELIALLLGAFAVDIVFIVIMVTVHTLLMFAFPLVVDRNLGAVKAMTTSARAVWGNKRGVVGLLLVNFGLALLGQLALCFGIYFVIPVIIASNLVAYRKVFPKGGVTDNYYYTN